MAKNKLNWDDARPFLALARLGTLSAAASHLHIGIATLSRRIERLEQALSVPLFIRTQAGYQLTEDGLALTDKAEVLESAAFAFSSTAASRSEISGRVRLATAETLATEIIMPALPRFVQLYPKLSVEVVTDIQAASLHRRDADLALRMVKPDRGNLSLQRVGTLGWGLYAHEDYLDEHPVGDTDAHLADHAVIAWSESHVHLAAAQWVDGLSRGAARIIATNGLPAQVAAAKARLGIAALPHYLTSGEARAYAASAETPISTSRSILSSRPISRNSPGCGSCGIPARHSRRETCGLRGGLTPAAVFPFRKSFTASSLCICLASPRTLRLCVRREVERHGRRMSWGFKRRLPPDTSTCGRTGAIAASRKPRRSRHSGSLPAGIRTEEPI